MYDKDSVIASIYSLCPMPRLPVNCDTHLKVVQVQPRTCLVTLDSRVSITSVRISATEFG